jgi:hypothetical protein
VLIDFGWSEVAGEPYPAPPGVGWKDRIPSGPPCDVYSMGKVFEHLLPKNSRLFAPLLLLMTEPSLARSLTLKTLAQVLKNLELPGKWDVPPVFPAARQPETVYAGRTSLKLIARPDLLRRTWQRWKRSLRKRFNYSRGANPAPASL